MSFIQQKTKTGFVVFNSAFVHHVQIESFLSDKIYVDVTIHWIHPIDSANGKSVGLMCTIHSSDLHEFLKKLTSTPLLQTTGHKVISHKSD